LLDTKNQCMERWVPRVGSEAATWRWRAQLWGRAAFVAAMAVVVLLLLLAIGIVSTSSLFGKTALFCLLATAILIEVVASCVTRRALRLALVFLGASPVVAKKYRALPPGGEARFQAWCRRAGVTDQ
jgi:hypothetical protein